MAERLTGQPADLSIDLAVLGSALLGGHWKHALAAELLLKPVLVEIGATCPTAGLFLLDSEYEASDTLDSWLGRARPQAAATRKGLT